MAFNFHENFYDFFDQKTRFFKGNIDQDFVKIIEIFVEEKNFEKNPNDLLNKKFLKF